MASSLTNAKSLFKIKRFNSKGDRREEGKKVMGRLLRGQIRQNNR